MARRNKRRKKPAKADGYIFPVPIAAVLSVISALALSYLWLGGRCEALGRELKKLELRKAEVHKVYLYEQYKWACLKTPESIKAALKRHGLTMVWPRSSRIVHLTVADLAPRPPEGAVTARTDGRWRAGYANVRRTSLDE